VLLQKHHHQLLHQKHCLCISKLEELLSAGTPKIELPPLQMPMDLALILLVGDTFDNFYCKVNK